ncbi:hypothetical protein SELMODRAFT_411413 [Selaginella moellendorffii]|uniref:Cilia- and flagella-associated protein 299 n=1 Tax=Selaginella moellendorffii TaxID=88036 RepID=D8RHU6_SELML|nr:hypothetical protein SELMODRAFT_411413 [Selaginella moellendorffii]
MAEILISAHKDNEEGNDGHHINQQVSVSNMTTLAIWKLFSPLQLLCCLFPEKVSFAIFSHQWLGDDTHYNRTSQAWQRSWLFVSLCSQGPMVQETFDKQEMYEAVVGISVLPRARKTAQLVLVRCPRLATLSNHIGGKVLEVDLTKKWLCTGAYVLCFQLRTICQLGTSEPSVGFWTKMERRMLEAQHEILQRVDCVSIECIHELHSWCYEEYLDSQISATDLFYLEDIDLARKLIELGYRSNAEIMTRSQFVAQKEAAEQARLLALKKVPKKIFSSGKDLSGFPVLQALAEREIPIRNGTLSTIVYIRDFNAKGHEVVAEGDAGVMFKSKKDRKMLNVHAAMDPGDNSTRTEIPTHEYKQAVLFDHVTRKKGL